MIAILFWPLVFQTCSIGAVRSLQQLSADDVLDITKESCLVVVNEPPDVVTTELIKELITVNNGVTSEVYFGITQLQVLSQDSRIQLEIDAAVHHAFKPSALVVFPRRMPDRTCLYTPHRLTVQLTGRLYDSDAHSPEHFLSFVNNVCGTYWSLSGNLTYEGNVRKWILDELYSVSKGLVTIALLIPKAPVSETPGALSLSKLDKDCDSFSQFFKTGDCGNSHNCYTKHLLHERQCEKHSDEHTVPKLPQCEEIDGSLSEGTFKSKYLFRSKPVIIRGAANQWPAKSKWTLEYFREKLGSIQTHVKLGFQGEFEGVEPSRLWISDEELKRRVPAEVLNKLVRPDLVMVRPAGIEIPFSEFLVLITNRNGSAFPAHVTPYLEYTSMKAYFEDFISDLGDPQFATNLLELHSLNLWLSDGNTLGKLHFDEFDNLLVQLSGRKQVVLFEPFDNQNLYEGHIIEAGLRLVNGTLERGSIMESTSMTMSPLDITKPDFEKFPRARHIYPLNCTIGPGDILYLPAFWWHEVQSFPDEEQRRNLAVNYWFKPFLNKEFPCQECKLDVSTAYRQLLSV